MYALFMPFWKHQASLTRVVDHSRYRRIAASPASLPPLPATYVAVRFYFSGCFPDTPANRGFVAATIASLAEHTNIVMLNPGFQVDDHVDYGAAGQAQCEVCHAGPASTDRIGAHR